MTTSRVSAIGLCSFPVFQNLECRQASGRAHDAAAGVGGRSAHIQVLDGRAELRPSRNRAQEKQLFERKFALEDVAFAQSPFAFEVERGDDLAMQNDVF